MKRAKWWIGLWGALGMAAGFSLLTAHGATATEWSYTVNWSEGTAMVTGASPAEGKLTIPSSLLGYPVTSIGGGTFSYCTNLTSVTIPDSVTNIEACAFLHCSGLAKLTIGRNVSSLQRAFYHCDSQPEIHLSPDNPYYVLMDNVFYSKEMKTLEYCPDFKSGECDIPDGVTSIGDYAFELCTNLTSVVIPESVTSIGMFAFDEADLRSLTIPDSVTNIGAGAFYSCGPLASVTIGNRVESIGGSAFCIGTPGAVMLPPSVKEMEEGVFYMSSVGKLYLPASWEGTMLEGMLWYTGERIYYNPETLSLASNSRLFTADAASGKELKVTGKVAWTAKSGASWLKVSRGSGTGNGSIVYDVAANTGSVSRTGTITVDGGEVPWTFAVVQRGRTATLEIGADERTFTAAAASSKELEVTATMSWTAKSSVSWLRVKKGSGTGNGTIVYDVAENTGTGSRTGSITVSGGGLTRTFTVTQLGKGGGGTAVLELAGNERTFTAAATTSKELEVAANVTWTAKSGVSWLTVRKGSGTGNGTIVYDVAENTGSGPRTGTITVTGGGLARTFTVTQERAHLALAGSYRTFTADAANSKELEVVANVSWTATADVSWLTVKKTSGTGNGTIVYNVAANTGSGSRKGKITVAGGGLTRILSVTQKGPGEKAETQEAPVGVPCLWLEKNATAILEENGGNYEAAAQAKAANGRAVWECYVAGVSATNAAENFTAVLALEDGKWVAKPDPDLGGEREYTVEGTTGIGEEAVWGPVTEDSRFFRLKAGMKRDE